MAQIEIIKSYKLENGDISGMFKIKAEDLEKQGEKQTRIELIDLEGKLATISLEDTPGRVDKPGVKMSEYVREQVDKLVEFVEREMPEAELPLEGGETDENTRGD